MPQVAGALAVTFFTWGANAELAVWLGSAAVRLMASVALGAIASQLTKNSQIKNMPSGIRTSVTQNGGVNPTSFVIGTFATAGYHVTPPMSHGTSGKTPNAYLTYVIEIADIRRMAVSRLVIDGEYVTLTAGVDADGFYGVTGKFLDHARVKFYDGTQTTADPWLLTTYGAYASRPWTSDMIGLDQCYAIVVCRYDDTIFNGFPQVRFETTGIPLYDPRADTTVGGSGAQRWATPSTWTASSNPMVQAYNIFRGISFVDGSVWGGGVSASDLPLTEWFAAMNACDVATPLLGGGTQPAYRSGMEILSSDEPMAVLEELAKACSGQFVDMGGVWKPKVGSVSLPSMFITDDDVIVTKDQDYDPFPGLAETYNGVTASYPEPVSLYESVSAPIRTSTTDETADGGRRLIADLSLSAVPYKDQVQRLMEAYRLDNRRFRRHALTLHPSALLLEPTDSISWTSTANGYTAKVFEVNSITDDLMTALQRVAMRERDSADYTWNAATDTKPTSPVPGVVVPPATQVVPSWAVDPVTLTGDVAGVAIPALKLSWNGVDQDGVDAIKYQIRLVSTGVTFMRGSTHDVESGEVIIADGIAGATAYEARARFVTKGVPTAWSAWDPATTGTATYIPSLGTFLDSGFTLQDNGDLTKQMKFELAGISTSTLVTVSAPTVSGKMVVSATGTIDTAELVNNAVTNAKAANMAAGTVKANITGAAANPADVDLTSFKAWLAIAQGDVSGLTAALVLLAPKANPTFTGSFLSDSLYVGTLSNVTGIGAALIQTQGIGASGGRWSIAKFSANATGPTISFAKGRAATIATYTIINAGDELGDLDFYGADGSTMILGARLQAYNIGTPVAGDVRGGFRLQTGSGAGAVATRLTVDDTTIAATLPITSTGPITAGFAALSAGTTAMAFATAPNKSVTPNATATLTTTVPAAGTICTLIINTSGTTSFTLTFGTGFKTTGTLVTGTVTAKTFTMAFISDGTSVIELSRTVAM